MKKCSNTNQPTTVGHRVRGSHGRRRSTVKCLGACVSPPPRSGDAALEPGGRPSSPACSLKGEISGPQRPQVWAQTQQSCQPLGASWPHPHHPGCPRHPSRAHVSGQSTDERHKARVGRPQAPGPVATPRAAVLSPSLGGGHGHILRPGGKCCFQKETRTQTTS